MNRLKSIAEFALWAVAGFAGLMALFNLTMAVLAPWPH
jgi:hypothetical protein